MGVNNGLGRANYLNSLAGAINTAAVVWESISHSKAFQRSRNIFKEMLMATEESQWYFDPSTGTVSQGKQAGWENRMGHYEPEADARRAPAVTADRNKATN